MSTSSGWDHRPPMHDPDRPPQDNTDEPVGYNLGSVQFEQPPITPRQPYVGFVPGALPTGVATTGFVLSLVGLVGSGFLSIFMLPLIVAGIVASSVALGRNRGGIAGGRGFAIAGLVLGILGVVLAVVMMLDFMTGSATLSP
jgi:hypothetical protein